MELERTTQKPEWLLHLLPLGGILIPFVNIILPLIAWQLYRSEDKGRESLCRKILNHQISFTLIVILFIPLCAYPAGLILEGIFVFVIAIYMSLNVIRSLDNKESNYPTLWSFIKEPSTE